jgi:hypothetical protein
VDAGSRAVVAEAYVAAAVVPAAEANAVAGEPHVPVVQVYVVAVDFVGQVLAPLTEHNVLEQTEGLLSAMDCEDDCLPHSHDWHSQMKDIEGCYVAPGWLMVVQVVFFPFHAAHARADSSQRLPVYHDLLLQIVHDLFLPVARARFAQLSAVNGFHQQLPCPVLRALQ